MRTCRHHVTHKVTEDINVASKLAKYFATFQLKRCGRAEERNGKGVRKLGSRILRMQYVGGGRGSLVRDVKTVTAVLSFH